MVLAPNEHLEVLPVSMYLPTGRRLRNPLADSGERRLRPEDITEVMGVPVTTMVRTAWDLGRVRSRERAIGALDQMLRLPGFPREEFLAGVERFRGYRWVTTLRTLAPLADGRAESPPESILRLYWIDAGLPWPTPQLICRPFLSRGRVRRPSRLVRGGRLVLRRLGWWLSVSVDARSC